MDKKSFIYTSLSFLIFIVLFFWFFFDAQSKMHTWIKTNGVVVNDKVSVNPYAGSVFYNPQVKFKTREGQDVVGDDVTPQFGGFFDNKVGEDVTVYYYPINPQFIYVYNSFYAYYFTLIPAFLFIGFYILFIYKISTGAFGKTSLFSKKNS